MIASRRTSSYHHLVVLGVAAGLVLSVALVMPARADVAATGALPAAEQALTRAQNDLRQAEEEVARTRGQLERAVAALDTAQAREAVAVEEAAAAATRVAAGEGEVAGLRTQISQRARAAYTSGLDGGDLLAVLGSDDPNAVVDRLALLTAVTRSGQDALLVARTALARLAEDRAEAVRRASAATAAQQEVAARSAAVSMELTRTQTLVAGAQAEVARRAIQVQAARVQVAAAAPAPPLPASTPLPAVGSGPVSAAAVAAPQAVPAAAGPNADGRACPVGPTRSFTDTYGAPRSGGRRHQGVDVFAPWGSPVYAVESGTVKRAYTNTLGGLSIWLLGDSGTGYYYAHNSANLVTSGQRVAVGEQIGQVGNTGDARSTAPHVHFEVHPGGGAAINPTPFARAVCG